MHLLDQEQRSTEDETCVSHLFPWVGKRSQRRWLVRRQTRLHEQAWRDHECEREKGDNEHGVAEGWTLAPVYPSYINRKIKLPVYSHNTSNSSFIMMG